MADFEPPSFSLGFDFDFEPSQQQQQKINSPKSNPLEKQQENEDEFLQLHVSDSEPDSPVTRFRRLRRGGPSFSKPISNSVDDDIESFSDDEFVNKNNLPAPKHHSSCSSSKLPLSGHGVLTRQHDSGLRSEKGKHDSTRPPSLGSSKGKQPLFDFTASPLRRFQLLDSDSDPDDPPDCLHIDQKSSGINFPKDYKQKQSDHGSHKVDLEKNTDPLPPISHKQDLWEDFCVDKSHSVETPAFDEFCEEYFRNIKSSRPGPGCQEGKETLVHQDSGSIVPPSHRYFLHDDLRIQNLVRSRLPYFRPLNTSSDAGFKSHNTSSIDYMSQFGQDGAKQKTSRQGTSKKSSTKGRKKAKNSGVEDIGSGDWINPKQTISTPKDAGRRRVHAEGQSAGQWVVSNGKKVYIAKNGKELTGRLAYMHYRKESGRGFKKSRKKTAAKKK